MGDKRQYTKNNGQKTGENIYKRLLYSWAVSKYRLFLLVKI